jgi:hypothetical protein
LWAVTKVQLRHQIYMTWVAFIWPTHKYQKSYVFENVRTQVAWIMQKLFADLFSLLDLIYNIRINWTNITRCEGHRLLWYSPVCRMHCSHLKEFSAQCQISDDMLNHEPKMVQIGWSSEVPPPVHLFGWICRFYAKTSTNWPNFFMYLEYFWSDTNQRNIQYNYVVHNRDLC